jgi:glycosyltransferase involved in cell wall biosynthesis
MHRSGTSAVTRVISLLGADLPRNLKEPIPDNNEKGFWESIDICHLNDQILESGGSKWDDWRRFNPFWFRSPTSERFKLRALELLERDFRDSYLFVLKDPRICRLLPFWLHVFEAFSVEPACALVVRNPLEVAASLRKRDGFARAKSLCLWLRHVLDAEIGSRGAQRTFVAYDGLMNDWRQAAFSLSDGLGIAWPRRSATSEVEIDEFLAPRHRHHEVNDSSTFAHSEVASWVKETYAAISELSASRDSAAALERLDAVRREFDRASDALGPVLRSEEMSREKLAARVEDLEQEILRCKAPIDEPRNAPRAYQARTRGLEHGVSDQSDAPVEPPSREATAPKHQLGRTTSPPFHQLYQEMLANAERQLDRAEYEPESPSSVDAESLPVRLIAFYLPQFHPIPENDEWWGKGFTEWTNVTKAVPQFVGHYQPRLPDTLGFYDLRLPEVQREQIRLARKHGVYGFCYHHYWFAGRRLLERPLQQVLEDRSLDFPFCICWANENWTRRWDGCDQEILIGQEHSPEDDLAFIAELEPALRDPRYITVDGRPLLIVYRPQLFPDPARTAAHWRKYARDRGFPEPYLVNVHSFPEVIDPRSIGFDAAVEFPPHNYVRADITSQASLLNEGFSGHIFDYRVCVAEAEARLATRYPYELYPGVMTGWDNTPRRLGAGTIFDHASPQAYEKWLTAAGRRALAFPDPEKRLVFVNAWNEWAEGTYLEPDRRYGFGYLRATSEALERLRSEAPGSGAEGQASATVQTHRVLLVGHDAHRHGAQLLTLHLARLYSRRFGLDVALWLLEGGALLPEYEEVADVQVIGPGRPQALERARSLREKGFGLAVTNTVVTGEIVPVLDEAGFSVVSLVHEMPELIKERGLQRSAASLAQGADHVVFAADTVRRAYAHITRLASQKAIVLPQGIYQDLDAPDEARAQIEAQLGLPPDAIVVINAGYGDQRKGFDIFLECARAVCHEDVRFHFLWVGNLAPEGLDRLGQEMRTAPRAANLHHVPFTDAIAPYYAAADALLLTSREDPFPSVVLEALACGLPVVAFEGSGGHCELLRERLFGRLAAPLGDVAALASALRQTVAEEASAAEPKRLERARATRQRFDFADYGWRLLRLSSPGLARVSIVVPNYNYARYMRQRLETLFLQTQPVFEIIVLDDASTDGSPELIEQAAAAHRREIVLIRSQTNSGSVFAQWARGIRAARGDYVWIAEADDLARPELLEILLHDMAEDDETVFAFSDSSQIDGDGARLGSSYADYCNEMSDLDFGADFTVSTGRFLAQGLAVKNTILNVSSVVFRRDRLLRALDAIGSELPSWTIAGDWRLYVEICRAAGKVHYVASPLNAHRRHDASVVGSNRLDAHIDEIARMHALIRSLSPVDDATTERQSTYLGGLRTRARGE